MRSKIFAMMLALTPMCSYAIPVQWTLEDVSVGLNLVPPGSTLVPPLPLMGSFVYDADTNLYSNVDIHSPTGLGVLCDPARLDVCNIKSTAPFPGQHYDTAVATSPGTNANGLVAVDGTKLNGILDGDTVLILLFAQSLTNEGGSISLGVGGTEYFCHDLACLVPRDDKFRLVIGPQAAVPSYMPRVVGVAVSEPQAWSLLCAGLAIFLTQVGFRRRSH